MNETIEVAYSSVEMFAIWFVSAVAVAWVALGVGLALKRWRGKVRDRASDIELLESRASEIEKRLNKQFPVVDIQVKKLQEDFGHAKGRFVEDPCGRGTRKWVNGGTGLAGQVSLISDDVVKLIDRLDSIEKVVHGTDRAGKARNGHDLRNLRYSSGVGLVGELNMLTDIFCDDRGRIDRIGEWMERWDDECPLPDQKPKVTSH